MRYFMWFFGLGACAIWIGIWVFLMAEPPDAVIECSNEPLTWPGVLMIMVVLTVVPYVLGYITKWGEGL